MSSQYHFKMHKIRFKNVIRFRAPGFRIVRSLRVDYRPSTVVLRAWQDLRNDSHQSICVLGVDIQKLKLNDTNVGAITCMKYCYETPGEEHLSFRELV